MKYVKLFETHTAYNTYINGQDKVLPNVSYCVDRNEIHCTPFVETKLVVKYNVTSTSSNTVLISSIKDHLDAGFTDMEIDGVLQESVVKSYKFDTTGIHTVKYTLADPTQIRTYNISGIFYGPLYNLASVYSIKIPKTVTQIDNNAFMECHNLTSVTIPSSVTSIGAGAFRACSALTSVGPVGSGASIEWPNSVTTIDGETFIYCDGLTNVTIPNSVTTINWECFGECTDLTSVTIGSGVTSIDDYVFNGCTSLSSVTVLATTPPTLGDDVFYNNASGRKIYVPSASVATYKAASGWSTYASDIEAIPSA